MDYTIVQELKKVMEQDEGSTCYVDCWVCC